MPEAVIVSVARSPIGRANKGSLKDLRPDELSAFIVRTALDKIPALDRKTVDDLYLGCGLPGGEMGNNMGRIVNVLNDMDEVPGATITRYCASSVQTTRMAFHAIKAGEGDVFISAGVETVSRFAKGTSDHIPGTRNEAFAAQVVPSYQELGIDLDRLNVNGGAIAVGHPFGMTGARLQNTLINSLDWHDKSTGLITMCVGGGQGMALILERLA
jgi:acetyl-CoA acetyltransferase